MKSRRTIARLNVAIAATALMVGACTSAGTKEEPTSPTTLPAAQATTTTTTTVVVASEAVSTTTTTQISAEPLTVLEKSFGVTASGDGWLIEPGSYRTSQLAAPIRLDLATPVAADSLADGLIGFGATDYTFSSDATFYLTTLLGIADPSVVGQHNDETPRSVPFGSETDTTAFFGPPFTLLASGNESIAGLDAVWWEFTVDPSVTDSFSCQYGSSCLNVAVHAEIGNLVAGSDWTFRLWEMRHPEGTVYAWLQGRDDNYVDGLALSAEILGGLSIGAAAVDVNSNAIDITVTATEREIADAFGRAYTANDFDSMSSLFASGTPELASSAGEHDRWTSARIEQEMEFADGVGDTWTVESCGKEFGRVTCRYFVTDSLTQRTGIGAQSARLFFTESDGKLADGVIDLHGFGPYDTAMHDFGSWHDETYPDEEPIHGIHYRGWNVEDPGAAERFIQHLDEWVASM